MIIPKKILIKSDGNEAEAVYKNDVTLEKSTAIYHIFRYTKSVTKLGKFVGWTSEAFQKLLRDGILVEIK